MVAFGENDVKNLEDLADCATDDLTGWVERSKEKGVDSVKHEGILSSFDTSREEAEEMILAARILLGWINPDDVLPAEGEEVEIEAAEGEEAEVSAEESLAEDASAPASAN